MKFASEYEAELALKRREIQLLEVELAAMRQRAEAAEKERDKWVKTSFQDAHIMDKIVDGRDAAVARAERAESDITTARLLLRSVWRSLDAAGRSMGRSLDAVALETAMELIDRHFETPFAKAQIYDESPVDFIESTRAAIAAAPDKPQYTDLSPEPLGGPEGEE